MKNNMRPLKRIISLFLLTPLVNLGGQCSLLSTLANCCLLLLTSLLVIILEISKMLLSASPVLPPLFSSISRHDSVPVCEFAVLFAVPAYLLFVPLFLAYVLFTTSTFIALHYSLL